MRLPSLKYLRTFQIAARHLSFKDAADDLSVTASAVSHQIRNLESFLGVPLFERKTRSLLLTEAGRNYFEFLDEMFSRLESETQQLWTQFGRSLVRLSVPPFFASEALLPRLSAFQDLSPETDIRVMTKPGDMKVHPPEADLSVLLGSDHWPEWTTHRLLEHRVVTACSPSFKKAHKLNSIDSLNGQTLIVHENRPRAWDYWARALEVPAPKAGKLIRFDSMTAIASAAEQGLGIALLSWPLCQAWFDSGALVRVLDFEVATEENFYLAHRPEDADRPEVRKLIDWLLDEFREYA